MSNKILFVDDEDKVLNGIERQLSDDFDIETATSGQEGLERIADSGPFAVVVSDMRMPGMNGVEFLSQVRERSPDTTRMLLTGYADLQTSMAAINDGHIFRFLTKPCAVTTLTDAVASGIKQYRLVNAERELVDGTLKGSIKVLSDVLGLVNPIAFGRASRVKRIVLAIAAHLDIDNVWELEIAAMMSALGCVTVSEQTLDKMIKGCSLSDDEESAFEKHPAVARSLLENIPRLEHVAEIVSYQEKHFDGGGYPNDAVHGESIPFGARILKAALDFDIEEAKCEGAVDAMSRLKKRQGRYDPRVIESLEAVLEELFRLKPHDIELADLRNGMVFAEHVIGENGQLLIAKGQEITTSVRQFLTNFADRGNVQQPLRVFMPSNNEVAELTTA